MKKRKPAGSAARPRKKKAARPRLAEQARLAADEISQSAAFRRATADADVYAGDPARLRKLFEDAVGKINTIPRGPFGETWPYLLAMVRVIRDYQSGEYRDMAAPKLLIIIAAIIYFVSPFDVIPDWIPVLGHIDDAFVITLALKSVRSDLDTFMASETARI
ncbi:MAG: YkvA family protein [Verrucomicrobiota bacterium]|nr:YkvA family protein [Verrucomicrobiota bacterium]